MSKYSFSNPEAQEAHFTLTEESELRRRDREMQEFIAEMEKHKKDKIADKQIKGKIMLEKFRVWDIKAKKYRLENIVINQNGELFTVDSEHKIKKTENLEPEFSIGSKDKNGIEIYENDKLELDTDDRIIIIPKWDNDTGSFLFFKENGGLMLVFRNQLKEFVKIGTIHD